MAAKDPVPVEMWLTNSFSMSWSLESQLRTFREDPRNNEPTKGWRRAFRRPKYKDTLPLPRCISELVSSIQDELRKMITYYKSPALIPESPKLQIRTIPSGLLQAAVRARVGSIALHRILTYERGVYRFGIDILDGDVTWEDLIAQENIEPKFRYRLMRETDGKWAKTRFVEVEDRYTKDLIPTKGFPTQDFGLFRIKPDVIYVKLNDHGSETQRYLRFPDLPTEVVSQDATSENPSSIFQSFHPTPTPEASPLPS
ncbi:MAG: hypothetical protein L6R37_007852 [Teloschistes peruensis]|nr:MAG: hypothetical protein L6R37_007852 [Teloschistes peruensis]